MPQRFAGEDLINSDNGTLLYPEAYKIGEPLGHQLEIVILTEPGKPKDATFEFSISGTPRDGEIDPPTEYRKGLYLAAKEPITLAEARALGKWLCNKADEYERPGLVKKIARALHVLSK